MLKRFTTHTLMALAEASLIALLVVGLIAGTAFAGRGQGGGGGGKPPRGGGGTTGNVALVMVEDLNGNGSPNWGDTITFNITTTAANPYLSLRCYQGGTLVLGADAGFYPDYPWQGARNMPLFSPSWTGGAASCSATVNTGGSLSFNVGA